MAAEAHLSAPEMLRKVFEAAFQTVAACSLNSSSALSRILGLFEVVKGSDRHLNAKEANTRAGKGSGQGNGASRVIPEPPRLGFLHLHMDPVF